MRFAYTKTFHRSYNNLTSDQQRIIVKAIKEFSEQPYHPFPKQLKVHKLHGVKGAPASPGGKRPPVWEMHANGPLIITFQYNGDEVIFRNCGLHDDVLRSP